MTPDEALKIVQAKCPEGIKAEYDPSIANILVTGKRLGFAITALAIADNRFVAWTDHQIAELVKRETE